MAKSTETIDRPLTLVEHLDELRGRIIKSVICMLISSCILYNFVDDFLPMLIRPVGKLVFIAPTEAFIVNIKLAFLGGAFLSSPYVLYHIWQFVSKGLRKNERKDVLIFGPLSFILFISGSLFGYMIIVPIGMNFLLGFATDVITPMITANRYLSFVGSLTFAFSMVFQLPLILLFLTKVGIVTPAFLSSKRRHAIVIMFILAAILTPPDVITQCLMAGPLLILYELGIVLSKIAYRPL